MGSKLHFLQLQWFLFSFSVIQCSKLRIHFVESASPSPNNLKAFDGNPETCYESQTGLNQWLKGYLVKPRIIQYVSTIFNSESVTVYGHKGTDYFLCGYSRRKPNDTHSSFNCTMRTEQPVDGVTILDRSSGRHPLIVCEVELFSKPDENNPEDFTSIKQENNPEDFTSTKRSLFQPSTLTTPFEYYFTSSRTPANVTLQSTAVETESYPTEGNGDQRVIPDTTLFTVVGASVGVLLMFLTAFLVYKYRRKSSSVTPAAEEDGYCNIVKRDSPSSEESHYCSVNYEELNARFRIPLPIRVETPKSPPFPKRILEKLRDPVPKQTKLKWDTSQPNVERDLNAVIYENI